MELELKHLAPYLPYKLKVWEGYEGDYENIIRVMNLEDGRSGSWVGIKAVLKSHNGGYSYYRPILRPLTDFGKEIDYGKVKINLLDFVKGKDPLGDFFLEYDNVIKVKKIPVQQYRVIDLMLRYHYDIFGLIKEGLAIDINTLK